MIPINTYKKKDFFDSLRKGFMATPDVVTDSPFSST